MRFIIDIHLESKQKRTYTIDAKDEEEAKDRLRLRLPPKDRDSVVFDDIKIDKSSISDEDMYGIFNYDS